MPFLDKDIIEFGFNLDVEQKNFFLSTEAYFKEFVTQEIKNKLWRNRKKGLTIKFNKWFNVQSWERTKYFQFLYKNWKSAYNIKSY